MERKPNTKTNDRGGRVNPVQLPADYQPLLKPWTDSFYKEAMDEALMIRQAVHAGVEWTPNSVIGEFMEKYTGEAEISPLYHWLVVEFAKDTLRGSTLAEQTGWHVEMDEPVNLGRGIQTYANMKNWEIREEFRRCDDPHDDFITRQVHAIGFLYDRTWETMDLIFAEKTYWEPTHQRPEEFFCNCGPVLTGYRQGCPCHGSRPAGHGGFAGHIGRRGVWFYNGRGVDHEIIIATKQLAASRTLMFMHNGPENMEGWEIGYDNSLAA